MALSSVYNLLHRHGWQNLAPDKRHPQSDPLAQEEWKKLPERLAEVGALWPGQGPIKLMFQSLPPRRRGTRLASDASTTCAAAGRPNRCGRYRPLCQAMLTHEYTYAYAAADVQTSELRLADPAQRQHALHRRLAMDY